MIKLFEKLLNLIYIQSCYFCNSTKENKLLCSKCYRKIHFMPESVFRTENGVNVYAATLYDDLIKKLIKDFKYYNKKQLASVVAELMYEYWKKLALKNEFVVIPVPIHKLRKKERKYNHMDIAAKEFCYLSGYKLNKKMVIRTKDTQKQYKLHKQERIKNIKGAFDIDEKNKLPLDTQLLIIDDITSTGITIKEIITLLQKNGYTNITALALSTPDIWN